MLKPAFLFGLCAMLCVVSTSGAQKPSAVPPPSRTSAKRIFAVRCAGCHGLDGRGGERAPNIATNPGVRKMSDAQLTEIISNGRPDFGMPAFRLIGQAEIHHVVGFLRILQGNRRSANLPGDAKNGKSIFFGKAGCSECHMILGQGGFIGPDLSNFGQSLTASDIRSSITDPQASGPRLRTATATLVDGSRITGVIRNEDNFSIQLQSGDGQFHFLLKSRLRALEHEAGPIMPADYGKRLSRTELDDLVKFLKSVESGIGSDAELGEDE